MTMPVADKDVIKRVLGKFEENDVKTALEEKDYSWMTITK